MAHSFELSFSGLTEGGHGLLQGVMLAVIVQHSSCFSIATVSFLRLELKVIIIQFLVVVVFYSTTVEVCQHVFHPNIQTVSQNN
jgi:hypothetical protein